MPRREIRSVDVGRSLLKGGLVADNFEAADDRRASRDRAGKLRDLLKGGLPQDKAGQANFGNQAIAIDPDFGLQIQDHFGAMDAAERDQAVKDAPVIGRAMAGVTDEQSYQEALHALGRARIDVADAPPRFDPRAVKAMTDIASALQAPVVPVSPRTAERQAQDVELRREGRSPGAVVYVGPQGQDFGDPPKDFVWARESDGTIALRQNEQTGFSSPIAIPVAGGPVEKKAEAGQEKKTLARESALEQADIVTTDIGRVFQMLDSAVLPTTGFSGPLLANLGGTAANDIQKLLTGVKAIIGFGELKKMKASSPTGGALGSVSERESELLQSVFGSLEQSQSEDQFRYNLRRVQDMFLDIIHGPGNRPNAGGATPGETTSEDLQAADFPEGTVVEQDDGSRVIQRGGQWVPHNG